MDLSILSKSACFVMSVCKLSNLSHLKPGILVAERVIAFENLMTDKWMHICETVPFGESKRAYPSDPTVCGIKFN